MLALTRSAISINCSFPIQPDECCKAQLDRRGLRGYGLRSDLRVHKHILPRPT
jgi:hypothetical protein